MSVVDYEPLTAVTAPAHTIDEGVQKIFEGIYTKRTWGSVRSGGSGPGSAPEATRELRGRLVQLTRQLRLSSIVDVTCGAMAWQYRLLRDLGDLQDRNHSEFRYHGVDIVDELVRKNQAWFDSHPIDKVQVSFSLSDMTNAPPPAGFDLLLSRDTLQHFSYPMIVSTLRQWSRAAAKWVLVSSYPNATRNRNLPQDSIGVRTFSIDLLKAPFCLPAPAAIFAEERMRCRDRICSTADGRKVPLQGSRGDAPKHLYLYDGATLGALDFGAMERKAAAAASGQLDSC
jgi:hypothetical protein